LYTNDKEFSNNFLSNSYDELVNIKMIGDRKTAISHICNHKIDVCVIDLQTDGEGFCKALKLIDEKMPIIIVFNMNNESIKLKAFDLGCDDCFDKQISIHEFYYRVKAILKRSSEKHHSYTEESVSLGSSTIDFINRLFLTNGQSVHLSRKEASLLRLFYQNQGKLLSREAILKHVWNSTDYYTSKSMDVYMTKLRKILKQENAVSIENVHGSGYIFNVAQYNY
jgi:two-component system, OmpR family, response regulator